MQIERRCIPIEGPATERRIFTAKNTGILGLNKRTDIRSCGHPQANSSAQQVKPGILIVRIKIPGVKLGAVPYLPAERETIEILSEYGQGLNQANAQQECMRSHFAST
jgi:hypothetical protein